MIPNEINDFLFEVLYSDGTPMTIKRQALEFIQHHNLTMGEYAPSEETVSVAFDGTNVNLPRKVAEEICEFLFPAGGSNVSEKIKAIKRLREYNRSIGMQDGLKECKNCIDDWKIDIRRP